MTTEASPAILHGIAPKATKDRSGRPGADQPQRFRNQGKADGTGLCTVTIKGPNEGFYWMVGRQTVDAPAGTCEVYVGDPSDVLNLVDWTANATKAVADNNTPFYVPSGVDINFVFRAVGANANCTVTGQYENREAS